MDGGEVPTAIHHSFGIRISIFLVSTAGHVDTREGGAAHLECSIMDGATWSVIIIVWIGFGWDVFGILDMRCGCLLSTQAGEGREQGSKAAFLPALTEPWFFVLFRFGQGDYLTSALVPSWVLDPMMKRRRFKK